MSSYDRAIADAVGLATIAEENPGLLREGSPIRCPACPAPSPVVARIVAVATPRGESPWLVLPADATPPEPWPVRPEIATLLGGPTPPSGMLYTVCPQCDLVTRVELDELPSIRFVRAGSGPEGRARMMWVEWEDGLVTYGGDARDFVPVARLGVTCPHHPAETLAEWSLSATGNLWVSRTDGYSTETTADPEVFENVSRIPAGRRLPGLMFPVASDVSAHGRTRLSCNKPSCNYDAQTVDSRLTPALKACLEWMGAAGVEALTITDVDLSPGVAAQSWADEFGWAAIASMPTAPVGRVVTQSVAMTC